MLSVGLHEIDKQARQPQRTAPAEDSNVLPKGVEVCPEQAKCGNGSNSEDPRTAEGKLRREAACRKVSRVAQHAVVHDMESAMNNVSFKTSAEKVLDENVGALHFSPCKEMELNLSGVVHKAEGKSTRKLKVGSLCKSRLPECRHGAYYLSKEGSKQR